MQGIEAIEAIGPSGTSSTSLTMRRHNLVPGQLLSNRLADGIIGRARLSKDCGTDSTEDIPTLSYFGTRFELSTPTQSIWEAF